MNWDVLQQQVRDYDSKFGWDKDKPAQTTLHAVEELGEAARNVLYDEGYKKRKFDKNELAEEIVDTLYLLIKLANHYCIDLSREWYRIPSRYNTKSRE